MCALFRLCVCVRLCLSLICAAPLPPRVYWALGGDLRRDRDHALAQFLEAAGEEDTPWQAPAFEWLGHWYCAVAGDAARAAKCYSRALALDPTLVRYQGFFEAGRVPCPTGVGERHG